MASTDAANSGNLLKVLISTDNHLVREILRVLNRGVWEKDEIRRDDSFRAFEEVLRIASTLKVDFVLLAGDLFHENKPSRATLVKAIQIVSKYCLNDKPVPFKILSDQKANFVSGRVNFEDPNLNIGLPIFTIHGNHDDPAGQDNLSAVDILSSCGLVNYFGKVLLGGSNIGRITLSPVLVQKGDTKVAVYGLGNIRDERLGRMFQTPGSVQWVRPASIPEYDAEDWLNIFVVHQNRVQHGAFAKNCLQESHIPPFLDLVIWGHEHECRADPEDLRAPDARAEGIRQLVIQPGSSVATALSEGEAVRKHVVLLEVMADQYRTVKYPLESVRPFIYQQVSLREQPELSPEEPEGVTQFLEARVNSLIRQAAQEYPPPEGSAAMLPMIRLKVDYTGFSTINSQRFGQKFVGKVANPQDILTWTKQAQRKAKAEAVAEPGVDSKLELLRPEALDQARIEDLISQHLGGQHLEILPEEELAAALHEFVEKEERNALIDCVNTALQETQAAAGAATVAKDDEVITLVQKSIQQRRTEKELHNLGSGSNGIDLARLAPSGPPGLQPSPAVRPGSAHMPAYDPYNDPLLGAPASSAIPTAPATAAPTTTGRGRGRGKAAAASAASTQNTSGNKRQVDLFETFSRGAGRTRGATATPSVTAPARGATQTTAAARTGGRGTKRSAAAIDSDDEVEEVDEAQPSAKRARSVRSTRSKKKMTVDSDDEAGLNSDSDDYQAEQDEEDDDIIESDDDAIEDSQPSGRAGGKGRGRGGTQRGKRTTTARGSGGSAKKANGQGQAGKATQTTMRPQSTAPSDSVIIDDDDDALRPPPSSMPPPPASQGRRRPSTFTVLGGSQRPTPGAGRGWGAAR